MMNDHDVLHAPLTWVFLGIIMLLSYGTFVHGYADTPQIWDESFYIADAQRELYGVAYTQPHPPLGKMLIAAGEWLLDADADDTTFLYVPSIQGYAEGVAFAGYRFIPVLLAWFTAPLLFVLLLVLTKRSVLALLVSSLYIFDNALVLQGRSAMLDGTLIFFSVCSALVFFLVLEKKSSREGAFRLPLLLGALLGCILTTKYQGAMMILLIPIAAWYALPDKKRARSIFLAALLGLLITFFGVWGVHFTNARVLGPRHESSAALPPLFDDDLPSVFAFVPFVLASVTDQLLGRVGDEVPPANFCDPTERGSPVWLMPFGGRSTFYRNDYPFGSTSAQYLYLQSNPFTWWTALAGVVAAVIMLALLLKKRAAELIRDPRVIFTIGLVAVYIGTMLVLLSFERRLYLHTYLPSLVIAIIIVGAVLSLGLRYFRWKETVVTTGSAMVLVLAIVTFGFFSPLTYHQSLTREQFEKRDLLPLWGLTCADCQPEQYLPSLLCRTPN
jgi:dolichyl-phosphate-mannose--protein O-mannosyl transferase